MSSITIPSSVIEIGNNAFFLCTNLNSINIPNSVTRIGKYAFNGCSLLITVTIPNSITYIDDRAFGNCTRLTNFTSQATTPPITGDEIFDGSSAVYLNVPCGASASYRASPEWNTFVYIQEDCGTPSPTNYTVTLSSNNDAYGTVTGGGTYADGETVTITATPNCGYWFTQWQDSWGNTLGYSPTYTFTINSDVERTAMFEEYPLTSNINDVCSTGQTLLYDIHCPEGTATLTGYTGTCTGDLVIPDHINIGGYSYAVTAIGDSAFISCSDLTSVTIPNSVTHIGYGVFSGCWRLNSIMVAAGNTHYDSRQNCNAIIQSNNNTLIAGCKNTIIPNTVTAIGDEAFCNLYGSLTSIIIPNSVTSIGRAAFHACVGLTSIEIPNSVTIIDTGAFELCHAITDLIIGNSVTSIKTYAFDGCTGIVYITINAEVPPTIGTSAFDHRIPADIPVYVPCGTVAAYQSAAGWNGFTNIQEMSGCSHTVTVLANNDTYGTVTGSGTYDDGATATLTATANCGYQFTQWNDGNTDNPRDIVVTQDTTLTAYFEAMTEFDATIASGQTLHFSINPGGTSVTITGHEANISGNLVIPATVNYCENNYYVTRIAADAFSSSSGLTSVTIPSTITYIGEYAFWYLVLDVYYLGTLSQWCDIDFNGYTFGGFNLYINNTLVTDVVIPEGIIQIKNSTFDRCLSLTSITIPSSVTSIGAAAFISCTGVTSVILPESLTTIGSQAFENCSGLTEITCLAATVPSLEDRAFTSVNATIPVYVPCGSVANYQAATGWSNFTNIQCISQSVTTDTMGIRTCTGQTLLFEVEDGNHTAKVIGYVGQCTGSLTVPAWFSVDGERYEVTAIGARAFMNCTGLESVTLPRGIILVDEEAFKGCSALIEVDMK